MQSGHKHLSLGDLIKINNATKAELTPIIHPRKSKKISLVK
jgi:hypothetical protein